MRIHVVIRYIGMMLIFLALFMLASAGVSLLNNHDSALYPLLLSSFVTMILGLFPLIFVERADEIKIGLRFGKWEIMSRFIEIQVYQKYVIFAFTESQERNEGVIEEIKSLLN